MNGSQPTGLSEFDRFWSRYPRRIAKLDALKAYAKARTVATAEEIQAGVETFLLHLPEEMRFIPHPATWLNRGSWADEYEALPAKPKTGAYKPYVPLRFRA